MGVFCELFGHSFGQSWDAEAVRSSDGALMVHAWSCRRCQATTRTYEPMDAFIERMTERAIRSGGAIRPQPDWMGPPKPAKFLEPPEPRGWKRWPQGMSLRKL
jgi:hypothetical protein